MTPYRVAHVPAVRRGPSLAMRIAMRVAEFWLAQDCKSLRWYRRAVGGVWVKKHWWFVSGYTWFRVNESEDIDVSEYESDAWP